MRTLARSLLLALASLSVSCARAAPGPSDVVRDFYATYLKSGQTGLPTGKELDRLRPFLSKDLLHLMAGAEAYQKDYATKNPDDKPPFIEGDLFSSLFEGPTSFAVDSAKKAGAGYQVGVRFEYRDPNGKSAPTRWRDVVDVKAEEGRFVIDDVELLGNWEFKAGRRLREVLAAR